MKTSTKYAIALTASLGMIMGILDNTIINIALIPIANDLKVELNLVQWLVTGYFLSQAAVIPVAGYLGNRFGTRRLFILCVILFTAGSLLCGLAQDATLLIIFRVIQGIGAGALFPVAQTLALDPFAPSERASAMAVVGVPILLGPVFGPILGGWLNDSFGWHYLFLINVPIGILTVILTLQIIPRDKTVEKREESRFDYIGLVLSILGVLAIVYAFTIVNEIDPATRTALNPQGVAYGWGYWLVWALAGAGVLLLAVFSLYELRYSPDPVLDLRLFKKYNFTIASLLSWVLSATVFGSLLLLPIFLQQVRLPHLTALETGLALMPQGLGATIGVALSGPLYNRLGVRVLSLVGSILLIISLWQLSSLTVTTDGWTLAPWQFMLGLGLGLTLIPTQTLALQALRGPALAKANSLFNVTRQIVSSVATAVIITLLVQSTTSHINTLQAEALRNLPPGTKIDPTSPQAQAAIGQMVAQAGTAANNDVFLILAIATSVVLVLALALPGRKKQAEQAALEGEGNAEPLISLG
ncbi:MAG TPA: DHA2 family efflux MFS transporter permease subunit [Chloroflexia bacterium]|nr:DHA2 family efflux MFS transporter permease subunit [Chloroflexia bacterium]